MEQLYGSDMITGEFAVRGQQVDKLIFIDKYIKAHPEFQEQYPIFKLLFLENTVKGYDEIIQDRDNQKKNLSQNEQKQIDQLYVEIIFLDPILTLTDLLERNDEQAVKKFIDLHPNHFRKISK